MSNAEKIKRQKRTKFRSLFNVSSHVPVIEDGSVDKPSIFGECGGWYTKGGIPISHPSAYSKKGWSNMLYIRSTKHILVPEGSLE